MITAKIIPFEVSSSYLHESMQCNCQPAKFNKEISGCSCNFGLAGELGALLVSLPPDMRDAGFWMNELDADRSNGVHAAEFEVAISRSVWQQHFHFH